MHPEEGGRRTDSRHVAAAHVWQQYMAQNTAEKTMDMHFVHQRKHLLAKEEARRAACGLATKHSDGAIPATRANREVIFMVSSTVREMCGGVWCCSVAQLTRQYHF